MPAGQTSTGIDFQPAGPRTEFISGGPPSTIRPLPTWTGWPLLSRRIWETTSLTKVTQFHPRIGDLLAGPLELLDRRGQQSQSHEDDFEILEEACLACIAQVDPNLLWHDLLDVFAPRILRTGQQLAFTAELQ